MPDVTPDPNQTQPTPAVTPDQQTPATPAQQPTPQNPAQQPQQSQAQSTQPTQSQAPAPQPTASQPHPVSRIFDGILKTMTGGPVTYIDANGQKQVAPQSRGTMAKSIVAAALAGLLTPTQYREGAFGSKVEDFGATAGNAAQAGKGVMDAARNRPQQISDEEQSRRLVALTSNSNLIKNMAASTLQGHAALQSMVASSTPLLDSIKEYEKNRVDNQPSALIGENLSKEEAEAKMQGHFTEWKAIPTGTVSVLNPETHQNEEHPTYSIVNPTVKVPLTEEAVNTLATVNPTYKGAWEATNGKVEVPLSLAVSTQHLVNEAHVVQAFADSPELKSAFPDMKQANVAAALRGPNGKSLATALDATRDAIAAGSPTYQTLNALRTAPNGRQLIDALGLSPDAVDSYIQKQTNAAKAEAAVAANAGKKELQDAKPITAATAPSIVADPNASPERKAQAQGVLDITQQMKDREATFKSQLAAAKANTNMMTGSMPDGTQVAGTQDELTKAGASGVTKLPAADSSKVSIARQLISPNGLLTNTQKDLAAFKPEELTAIGNRWNEFAAGTLGSGDPRYIRLRTDSRLLSTALMQAHVGSRGSESIMEHFEGLANAGKMDGDTLRAALETERRYVEEKAMLPNAASSQPKSQSAQPTQQGDPAAAFGGKTRQ
jgi:hypothetical protein